MVHPKKKMLTLLTHPHVVPNLYRFISSVEHKRRYYIKKNIGSLES